MHAFDHAAIERNDTFGAVFGQIEGRNDFLGTINKDGSTLKSFGINPGGYVAYYDPQAQRLLDYDAREPRALQRKKIKQQIGGARRMTRFKQTVKKKG